MWLKLVWIVVWGVAVGGGCSSAWGQPPRSRQRLEQQYALDTLNPHIALAAAIRAGDPLAVQYFLHRGANPGVLVPQDIATPNIRHVNALVLAIRLGQTAVVPHLLADARTNARTAEGTGLPPLLEAGQRGQWRVMESLIDKGAPLNIQDSLGRNILDLLAELDSTAAFVRMWQRWETASLAPHPTPRMAAAAVGNCNVDLINFLESNGLRVHEFEFEGRGAAVIAIERGLSLPCLNFLASRGVAFQHTAPTQPGQLPMLHRAIWANQPQVVEFLLKHGTDPRTTYRYSPEEFRARDTQLAAGEYSALMLAESLARQQIARLLRLAMEGQPGE